MRLLPEAPRRYKSGTAKRCARAGGRIVCVRITRRVSVIITVCSKLSGQGTVFGARSNRRSGRLPHSGGPR